MVHEEQNEPAFEDAKAAEYDWRCDNHATVPVRLSLVVNQVSKKEAGSHVHQTGQKLWSVRVGAIGFFFECIKLDDLVKGSRLDLTRDEKVLDSSDYHDLGLPSVSSSDFAGFALTFLFLPHLLRIFVMEKLNCIVWA